MEILNAVVINSKTLPVKEYNGVRVVTFKDIDELHERPDGTASRNFRQNREHFIDGEDYFTIEITDDEIRRQFGAGKNAGRELTLVTESGYMMITKSFKDDLAWHIHRQLVNIYFRAQKAQQALSNLSPQTQAMIAFEIRLNEYNTRLTALESRTAAEQPEPKPEQPKAVPKKWSEREKDYLRRAYALGQTDTEIAADLGRTVGSVRDKRTVLGLVSQMGARWKPDEDKKLIKYRKKGLTCREISQILGKPYGGVRNRLYLLIKKDKVKT